MKNKIFALVLACLTFWIYPALSKEVIKSFDSLLQVQKDGSIIVTETIVVHHEGKNIRRGIYRDLSTVNGERYELLDVKRNFNAEPNFVEKRQGWYRINTGNNRFLSHPGTSTFEIKYKVWNVPTSFEGYDEVYWNVTGDGWAFPIEKVSTQIELPENAKIIQQASYIGKKGSKNRATDNGYGKFTGRYLNPGEQLTVAVGFTPGIVSTQKKEVIESFDSLLQVQKDGSIIVTETIEVYHKGDKIKRGIYRDLPTVNGEKYELLEVKRNFHPEPSFVEKGKKYFRINTGDNSLLPAPAQSVFEIKYRVWNIPESYDGYDEVYWNVTGDRWDFPIEKVSARVELPENATIMQQASYIGHTGSKNHATYNGDGKFTGKHLSPGEQLTIAVGFTPEIVSTQKKWNTVDWLLRIIPCCFIIYLLFLLWVWNLKGRDPFKRAIMPQFDPPEKLTAVQAATLYYGFLPFNLLTISFTQMISTGFLKVTTLKRKVLFSETKKYILEKTGKPSSNIEEDLTLWERKILKGYQDGSLIAEENRLRRVTEKRMQSYYKKNTLWVSIPTFIMLYPIIMTMFFHFFAADTYIFPAFLSLLITPIISKRYNRVLWENIVSSFFLLLFISPLILIPLFSEGGGIAALLLTVYFLATALTASVFGFLVYQPSVEGQRLIEHLEGLYLFLKTVKSPFEDQRKIEDILDEKKMEDIFPYAMALGLEEEWKNKFKKLFGLEAYNTFRHSHPYMSRDFTRSFHSVTSSSHSSGHHSGSGGGGFSGGGFGGGGGGGR